MWHKVRSGAAVLALNLSLILLPGLHAENLSQQELLAELEAFEAERSTFRRLLPGKQGVSAESVAAYHEALFAASEVWVERWPRREFAWRARLQALLGLDRREPATVREAVARALQAGREPSGIVYPEPLELLAARVLVRHMTDLGRARDLAEQALRQRLAFLDRLETARSEQASDDIAKRRRRWRWDVGLVLSQAAAADGDPEAWAAALKALAGCAPPRPKPGERDAAVEYAAGQLRLHLEIARWAQAGDRMDEAIAAYQHALRLRPAFASKIEPPTNQSAIDEARAAWLAAGRAQQDWEAWLKRQKGFPIPDKRP